MGLDEVQIHQLNSTMALSLDDQRFLTFMFLQKHVGDFPQIQSAMFTFSQQHQGKTLHSVCQQTHCRCP